MVDALSTVSTLLSGNWTAGNTDNITPTIDVVYEYRQIDVANGDWVLLYLTSENHSAFAIGGTEWLEEPVVTIDIRTSYKKAAIGDIRAHLIKIRNEALRIIRENVSNPDANYYLILPRVGRDLSDRSIGLGRWVFEAKLERVETI